MRLLALTLLTTLLLPGPARADRLAVLELRGSAEVDALIMLTNAVRAGAVDALRGTEVSVMTRENMAMLLGDMGIDADCAEGVCEVETARNLGAQFVLSGEVLRVEGSWAVDLKLHETKGATLLDTREAVGSSHLDLREVLKAGSERLVAEALGLRAPEPRASGGLIREESAGFELESAAEHVVTFESEPSGAVVLSGGTLLCSATPCSKRMQEGGHRIEMQMERHLPATQTVQVVGGMRPVHLVLGATFGWLTAETDPPGLALTVDGRNGGAVLEVELDPGVHEVLLADDRCHLRAGERVVIEAGERSRVTVPARPREAGVRVDVEDTEGNALEARVLVDGAELGPAPGPFKVPLCSKTVEVRAEGFGVWADGLELVEGEVAGLTARLEGGRGFGGGAAEGLGGLPSGRRGVDRRGEPEAQEVTWSDSHESGLAIADPIVLGALDRSIIDRIVGKHLSQIRDCYQKELNQDAKLSGDLVVKFVISKDGNVSSASTKKSTLGNPTVEKCVNSRFMRMRFPSPKSGGIVIVSYPFRFRA